MTLLKKIQMEIYHI